jgi:hypothetical protein
MSELGQVATHEKDKKTKCESRFTGAILQKQRMKRVKDE